MAMAVAVLLNKSGVQPGVALRNLEHALAVVLMVELHAADTRTFVPFVDLVDGAFFVGEAESKLVSFSRPPRIVDWVIANVVLVQVESVTSVFRTVNLGRPVVAFAIAVVLVIDSWPELEFDHRSVVLVDIERVNSIHELTA